ncbi:MAG TPA: hypothetical protein VGO62_00705 [Myxococcota bacterium]|jgi:hypothetical protein
MITALAFSLFIAGEAAPNGPNVAHVVVDAGVGAAIGAVVGGAAAFAGALGLGYAESSLACSSRCVDNPGLYLIYFSPVIGVAGALAGAATGAGAGTVLALADN